MLKGPEIYNPLYSVENATNRRSVLQNMVAAGYIDQKRLISQRLWISMASWSMLMKASRRITATHPYFDAVINEAVNEYGLTEEDIVKNGYRIYTELDQNYQASMQVILTIRALFP